MSGYYMSGRSTERLEEELELTRERVRQYEEAMQRIRTMPTPRAVVVNLSKDGKSVLLAAGSGSVLEVPTPPELAKKLRTGTVVRCASETMAVLGTVESPEPIGEIVTVRTDGTDDLCEVDYGGKIRAVRHGLIKPPEAGDRVIVDSTCSVAVLSLGKDDGKFSFTGDTGVSWEDVGGLEKAKEDLREAVEMPFLHPELYKAYGKKPARGVMLFGPPGCGKTLLAKAVATAVGKVHGASAASTGFVYVKGPELLDKFIGATEAQIRALFARTRAHFRKHGSPAVLFIDEADAILGKRGARLNMGTETTVVPQFLSEMDGLHEAGCVVLLATNRPDTLDPAVTREGRVDVKIHVERPDRKGVEDVMRLGLSKKPLSGDLERSVKAATDAILSPENVLYEILLKDRTTERFTLKSLVSGAMISTVVERATTEALREDVKRGAPPSGISTVHLEAAVKSIFQQNLRVNHDEALEDFCEPFSDKVKEIRRPKPEASLIRLS